MSIVSQRLREVRKAFKEDGLGVYTVFHKGFAA